MIELRWSTRPGWDGPEKVLQYRHWLAYAADNGNLMFPWQTEWSDWKDVPCSAAPGEGEKK